MSAFLQSYHVVSDWSLKMKKDFMATFPRRQRLKTALCAAIPIPACDASPLLILTTKFPGDCDRFVLHYTERDRRF